MIWDILFGKEKEEKKKKEQYGSMEYGQYLNNTFKKSKIGRLWILCFFVGGKRNTEKKAIIINNVNKDLGLVNFANLLKDFFSRLLCCQSCGLNSVDLIVLSQCRKKQCEYVGMCGERGNGRKETPSAATSYLDWPAPSQETPS